MSASPRANGRVSSEALTGRFALDSRNEARAEGHKQDALASIGSVELGEHGVQSGLPGCVGCSVGEFKLVNEVYTTGQSAFLFHGYRIATKEDLLISAIPLEMSDFLQPACFDERQKC